MSRMVTRMFQLGRNCPTTTLRVVEGSYEDHLLQRMAGPPRPKPANPPMSFRESVRAWYYQLRWLVLLIACQIGSLGYVFWSVHRMVHGS